MNRQYFPIKILGKDEDSVGIIFKKKVYKVAFDINGSTGTKEVPFDQYCMLEIGKTYEVEMYTNDNETWYFVPNT